MNDTLARSAMRLLHDRTARGDTLASVLEAQPDLSPHGFKRAAGGPGIDDAQLCMCLRWLAVCGPLDEPDRTEGSLKRKEDVERLTGYKVDNGALIAACLMCNLVVEQIEGSASGWLGVKSPAELLDKSHLLACNAEDCSGKCVLTNHWSAVLTYRHPTLREVVAMAGFFWDDIPPRWQHDIEVDYTKGPDEKIADEISGVSQFLSDKAPEAHETWVPSTEG
ncbi:hypothetical protein [Candidatus Poriferisodalis sp.]|uniref:hypothetical protein n=1 Tax=Candidatus Poriferisodalis sp. TaxID=3101277 RepID=UPI003B02C8BF